MTYTLLDILLFVTYGVVSIVGVLLIVVLIRLFFVLGLLRDILKRIMFHRRSVTDALTQIRLFCLKYSKAADD